jgi:acetyltransferase-like isoleucine patch superfamily enzyme
MSRAPRSSGRASIADEHLADEFKVRRVVRSVGGEGKNAITHLIGWLVQNGRGVRVSLDSRVHRSADIEQGCVFAWKCRVTAQSRVGAYSYASGAILEHCIIGRFCSIAPGAKVGLKEHPTTWLSTNPRTYDSLAFESSLEPTVLGHDVWVGANTTILGGVNVGNGAVIAAGSVVVRDVPANEIHAGVPARRIGDRPGDSAFHTFLDGDHSPAELAEAAARMVQKNRDHVRTTLTARGP